MSDLLNKDFWQLPIAVIDFETTGLNSQTERVLQASVVHINGDGKPRVAFESLITPVQRIAPIAQEMHSITSWGQVRESTTS